MIKSTLVGEEYTLTVGSSTIHMNKEGKLEITALNLQIAASEYVEIKGKHVCINGCGEHPVIEKASKEEKKSTDTHNEKFVLKDGNKIPIPNFKYMVTLEDGTIFYGATDEKGETDRILTGNSPMKMKFEKDQRGINV